MDETFRIGKRFMEDVVRDVLTALDGMGIDYELIQHEPAASIEQCRAVQERLRATVAKNLFLTTRRQNGYYLFVMRPDAAFKSGEVSRQAGTSRLCFAEEAPLYELLREKPGSVSPMGLLFDTDRQVTLLVDRALMDEPRLVFHPCLNTWSLSMKTEDFFSVFLPAVKREPVWIEVSE